MYYFFPFDEIKKDIRIILYAAGNIGKAYYKQICDTGFCEIVLWVDENSNGESVFEPSAIKNLRADEYDLVIIAIKNKETVARVKRLLLEYDVPESKIFHKDPTAYVLADSPNYKWIMISKLTLDDFLRDKQTIQDALLTYFYESEGNIEYFSTLIHEMKQAVKKDNAICTLIQRRASEIIEERALSPEAMIVLLRILFDAECFSSSQAQQLIKLTGEIRSNLSQKYWLLMELSYMWFCYPNILYDDFFTDKKLVMRDFAEELHMDWAPPRYERENNREICIVIRGFRLDSILQMVAPIIRELDSRGYAVHVVNLESLNWDAGANFLKPTYTIKNQDILLRSELLQYYPDSINLHYVSATMMIERQQIVLDLICKINPYCIIDVTDDCSIISYYYSQSYPTICLPIKKQDASSSFFHKIVISSEKKGVSAPIRPEQVLYLPMYKEKRSAGRAFQRSDYGFSSDDIIVVTAGNRLQYDLRPNLIDQLCIALSEAQKVKWLCVGSKELAYLQEHYPHLVEKQVFLWGYEDDLQGLYGICDIYLNPERTGGGTTIAWAMQEGLAVASPLGADAGVAHIGDKLSVKSESDLIPYVLAMANNPELLKENQNAMLEISSKWSIEAYVDKLIEGIDELSIGFVRTLRDEAAYEE